MAESILEVWMRGPIAGVPPLLQPVAHALLQAVEESEAIARRLPADRLWVKPAGMACAGFHLQHLTGVLDRLFTYADGRPLTPQQLRALQAESIPNESLTPYGLWQNFDNQVKAAIAQLQRTPETSLLEARGVGRKQIPSTVQGLLFHAAEHTQRHLGQLLVTAAVVMER